MAVRDFSVRLLPFPNQAADSCVVTDPDGSGYYTIVINANLPRARQERALLHELEHIENEDLHSDTAVAEIERRMAY